MPRTRVIFYCEADGRSPAWEWLRDLRATQPRAFAKCLVRIQRLAEMGHELRRPEADYLRDGIHELRARMGSVNYRVLYFFHGRDVAILAHGLTKEAAVPAIEIQRAVARKKAFENRPSLHTFAQQL